MTSNWFCDKIFIVSKAMERNLEMELEDRIKYAKRALDGIALGDCFGQSFFMPEETARQVIKNRDILNKSWHFTDDTVMAIGFIAF